jgi:short-subunit dehydrogenase
VKLTGAVSVVTGASSGIGEATARTLARRGATVVLAARRADRLERLAAEISEEGGSAMPVRCDVTNLADVGSLATLVQHTFGRCDVLVNNAGIPGRGAFADLTMEQMERVVRVNQLGLMFTTKALLPAMLARRRGHIVNVASLAGRFAVPGASVYGATKHAVVAFSESLHFELRPRGVLVTAVNPGFVRTEGFPQEGRRPSPLTLTTARVAEAIARVVRDGVAPEYTIPRWVAPIEALRIVAPPLYRWGMDVAARRYAD